MKKRILLPLFLLLCTTAWATDEREIAVQLTVPDTAWALVIDEVHEVGNELWVIIVVSRSADIMGAQVISTVQASLKLALPELPARYFIIGKAWNWKNEEPYTFIKDRKQIENELAGGRRLYRATD